MSLPEITSSIAHYDEIPDFCLGLDILDIGSSNGSGAYYSRHKNHFSNNNYLGIDIQDFDKTYFQIIKADFLTAEIYGRYDTILLLHVLEHFKIDQWPLIFEKTLSLLNEDGYLVVNVPYKEKANCGIEEYMVHEVLGIDEKLLSSYCQFDSFLKVGANKVLIFRNPNESIVRATVRFFKRIILNHKYSFLKTYFFPKYPRIVAIYKNEK